ncbi:precorrin-4 C(11)-methyltransferase [[Clostridium] aminophilum]|uniref:Precorrin-4/cobalt-precorrin-4 C11-methyltransferase n=1 Tax=[Clostridium] aminophilum TaxID=1526 RepID=A0A1I6IIT8_9FIRM|nr:precorrin-4 C(11)-methyltransferase [[Clostridium] aminophilum]SFR66569.1 precorrin-4/cobalt-precorrin-4 C11-methyltransferase [[Clostridium] aminophilum]
MVNFVGAGPGAVDLITVRGRKLIEEADCIIYAGSLVNPGILAWKKDTCEVYDSSRMSLPEVIAQIEKAEQDGKMTVRLHTGDPSVYGAIREQMDALDERKIPYAVCPGVSSFCAAAAALQMEYTLPGVSQSVIITRGAGRTPVPERESVRSFAAHQAVMVLFLSSGMAGKMAEELMAGGYHEDTPCAMVYRASWPDEKIVRTTVGKLEQAASEAGITRQALIVVGDAVAQKNYNFSKLYDPAFTTGYRKGTSS